MFSCVNDIIIAKTRHAVTYNKQMTTTTETPNILLLKRNASYTVSMPVLHPTLQKIVEGKSLKTTDKLALDDPAWRAAWNETDSWHSLKDSSRGLIARQWLRQLYARAQHASHLEDDYRHAIPKHADWIALLLPYIEPDWFANQNLGSLTGQLAKVLGLPSTNPPELLVFAWRATAEERAQKLLTPFFGDATPTLKTNTDYNQMAQNRIILPRLWSGAREIGPTKEHRLAVARLAATLSFARGSDSVMEEPFNHWQKLGTLVATDRAYFPHAELLECREHLNALPLDEVLPPFAALLKKASLDYALQGSKLASSGILPKGRPPTPFSVLEEWYPEYQNIWAMAESLDMPVQDAVEAALGKSNEAWPNPVELPAFDVLTK